MREIVSTPPRLTRCKTQRAPLSAVSMPKDDHHRSYLLSETNEEKPIGRRWRGLLPTRQISSRVRGLETDELPRALTHHQGVFGHAEIDQAFRVAFRIHVLHDPRDSVRPTPVFVSDRTTNNLGVHSPLTLNVPCLASVFSC